MTRAAPVSQGSRSWWRRGSVSGKRCRRRRKIWKGRWSAPITSTLKSCNRWGEMNPGGHQALFPYVLSLCKGSSFVKQHSTCPCQWTMGEAWLLVGSALTKSTLTPLCQCRGDKFAVVPHWSGPNCHAVPNKGSLQQSPIIDISVCGWETAIISPPSTPPLPF